MEEGRVEARSLTHNTSRGRGACWSFKMGLERVDKLHSLTWAYTQPTQSGKCIIRTPLVLKWTMGNRDTLDSPRPKLGGSHHHPRYNILCGWPRSPHPNGFSFSGLPNGSLEIALVEIPTTLEPHSFAKRPQIEMRFKANL